MTPESFFKLYYHSAVRSEKETGVPALVVLAQAAIESGWGERAPGNMFFGIKAGSGWKGKKQLITTREVHKTKDVKYPEVISIIKQPNSTYVYQVKDYFRAYDTAAESFADHGRFLRSNPRYGQAFNTTDPLIFAKVIAAAGYATDPNYFKLLSSIIGRLGILVPENKLG